MAKSNVMADVAHTENTPWFMEVAWPDRSADTYVYDLAHPLEEGMPHHPGHPPYGLAMTKPHGEVVVGPQQVSGASELIVTGGHVGTHIDALNHISIAGKLFGGVEASEHQSLSHGIDLLSPLEMRPLLRPGFLFDIPSFLGRELNGDDEIDSSMLEGCLPGDSKANLQSSAVFVRTGWARYWSDRRKFLGMEDGVPGVSLDGARWLTAQRVRIVGSDTVGFEPLPTLDLAVHAHLIAESGVPIIECLDLERLAADHIQSFFLICVPLPLRGATGSPIRPIAIVSKNKSGA